MSEEQKKFEMSAPLAILLSGGLIAGAIIFTNSYQPAEALQGVEAAGGAKQTAVAEPSAQDHWRGNPEAPIVLVEYSDFECPFCASIHPTLKRIVDESQGEVAWVYRHLPLESIHPQARPAAIASECIAQQLGSDGFWAFADQVFGESRPLSAAYYSEIAAGLGADPAAFTSCVASGRFNDRIDAHMADALQNGGNGTPFTVVVAGGAQTAVSGALPYAQIMTVINAAKARL
jgi:protein-disulfide isomerase